LQDEALTAWLAGEASALAEGALQLPALLDFPPSLVTASLVYVARRAAGTYPAWPPCLGALTGASLDFENLCLQILATKCETGRSHTCCQ